MVDKILLAILILLLPIGLLVGNQMLNKVDESANSAIAMPDDTATVEDLEKMLQDIQQNGQAPAAAPTSAPVLVINDGTYASDSGVLTISGIAPDPNRAVLVSATVLPANVAQPQEVSGENQDDNGVLGQQVEVRSIKTQPSGSFGFEYHPEISEGVIELTFEQKPALKVVQFDIATGRQVNY